MPLCVVRVSCWNSNFNFVAENVQYSLKLQPLLFIYFFFSGEGPLVNYAFVLRHFRRNNPITLWNMLEVLITSIQHGMAIHLISSDAILEVLNKSGTL